MIYIDFMFRKNRNVPCCFRGGVYIYALYAGTKCILPPYRGNYGVVMGLLWGHYGLVMGSFWGCVGVILGMVWGHFRTDLENSKIRKFKIEK